MKTALLEIQPTSKGQALSWINFKTGKISDANWFEAKLGFTVIPTDIVTNIMRTVKCIDENLAVKIKWQKGLLFPEFYFEIKGDKFEIEIEKKFVGGSDRSNVFNYQIDVLIFAEKKEHIDLILNGYKKFGSIPKYSFIGEKKSLSFT